MASRKLLRLYCPSWNHSNSAEIRSYSITFPPLYMYQPGIARMQSLARSRVWWASLIADLEAKVWTCTKCQSSGPPELVSCPDPLRTCKKEGLVFWAILLVTWGRVASWSKSLNQILKHIIICAWHKWSYFDHILNQIGGRKTYLAARSQLSQET